MAKAIHITMAHNNDNKPHGKLSSFEEGRVNALYAAIIDSSADAIISKTLDGTIQTWNNSAERIFGYTEQEAVGQHISILFPKEYLGDEEKIISRIKRKERLDHYETKRKRKDGSLIDVSLTISPIIDSDGVVVGASKIARDISERKNSEREVIEQNKRLQQQANSILDVLLNYIVKDFSQKAPISDVGDELDAIAVGLNTLGEELSDLLEAKKAQIELLEGTNAGLESNVAERTAELMQYKYALDVAGVVEITDTDGTIIYGNNNKIRLTGYARDEFIGANANLVNSGYHTKEFFQHLWDTIKAGNVWKGEIKNKAKDGSYYWVDTTIVPFLDANGKPYQYMAIKYDITLKKLLQEEEQERAAELKAVNKELESFSYSVSHDLRAPLRAVDGYALMLEEDFSHVLDAEGNRLLGVIRTNAQYMGNLIDDLLNFSRLGRRGVKKAKVNMTELVENVLIEMRETQTITANITLQPLHQAMADKSLLTNVFVNLISNAIKYSSKKAEPKVEIKSEEVEGEVVYSVSDNGAGFEMEYVNKLFGVFQRLHTTDEFEGTGVGLAIVQRIIHKHGGRVWAHGEVDKGATFYFTLPAANTDNNLKEVN